MTETPISPPQLAAGLAARLLHDLAGAASGIATGIDLYDDPQSRDMREAALDLIRSSDRSLRDLLTFSRVAYGGAGDQHAVGQVRELASIPFAGRRARLDWPPANAPVDGVGAQVILLMAQLAAAALAAGGSARVSTELVGESLRLRVVGEGRQPQLHREVLDGLAGRPMMAEGMPGRWAPACLLHGLVHSNGGAVRAATFEGGFTLEAALPARVSGQM
jgi:hypothetical protein